MTIHRQSWDYSRPILWETTGSDGFVYRRTCEYCEVHYCTYYYLLSEDANATIRETEQNACPQCDYLAYRDRLRRKGNHSLDG